MTRLTAQDSGTVAEFDDGGESLHFRPIDVRVQYDTVLRTALSMITGGHERVSVRVPYDKWPGFCSSVLQRTQATTRGSLTVPGTMVVTSAPVAAVEYRLVTATHPWRKR